MIQEEKGYKESDKSETEGARRATVVSDLRPDSEVPSNHPRRHYTDKYKKEVVFKVPELRQTGLPNCQLELFKGTSKNYLL